MITLTDKKTKNHKKSRTFQDSRVSESIGETEVGLSFGSCTDFY